MMVRKKEFIVGAGMLVAFFVVLFIMFAPIFSGHNALNYLDALYNSISKGSAYYIPKVQSEVEPFSGRQVDLTFDAADSQQADQLTTQLMKAGALVNRNDKALKISGDFGGILQALLADAESMYQNDGDALAKRYGFDARVATYNWWYAANRMDKALKAQKLFKEAKVLELAKTKAVETAYNYYGVQAEKISGRIGVVIFSLLFYVIYTLWYGFAILYLFEGWGMNLEH
jgi:hypothetical protein